MVHRKAGFQGLGRAVVFEAVPYTFTHGQGGVLAFLWAVGVGVLTVVYPLPALAAGLTAAFAGLAAFMIRGNAADRETRAVLIGRVVRKQFDGAGLADENLRAAVERAATLFVEMQTRVTVIAESRGPSGDLQRVLATAWDMLGLQLEAARRVGEYTKLHELLLPKGQRGRDKTGLRAQNAATLAKLIDEDRELAAEVNEKLEAMVLQVVQLERGTGDLIETAEFAEKSDGSLQALQAMVEARREAAALVCRAIPTES